MTVKEWLKEHQSIILDAEIAVGMAIVIGTSYLIGKKFTTIRFNKDLDWAYAKGLLKAFDETGVELTANGKCWHWR